MREPNRVAVTTFVCMEYKKYILYIVQKVVYSVPSSVRLGSELE